MTKISPFPYKELPQLSASDVQLKHKLLNSYYFFQNQINTIGLIADPIRDILKTDLIVKIVHLEAKDLASIVLSCSEHAVMAVIHLEPHGKKVLLVFESLLAKILVHRMLSGDEIKTEKLFALQMKPLTVLEEAVVEYILVAAIEKMPHQDFSATFEDVIRDPQKLTGFFSHQETFAVISLGLHLMGKDFFVKLILPLTVAENLGIAARDEYFVNQRLKQFEKFPAEFQLEIGRVTLNQSDLKKVDAGDIVLFDDVSVDASQRLYQGQAHMKLCGESLDRGYVVGIETKEDRIQAKIIAAL